MSSLKKSTSVQPPASLDLGLTAAELVAALLGLGVEQRLHLLDSGGARGVDARFLIAGFDPFEVIESYGDELHVWRRGEGAARVERGSLLALLDERLEKYRITPATGSPILPR
ncbi:MAG: hypothetical protein H0T60_07120, partial [Acidobacteria bacterium]|nr:hypothetical protein [Acidobacteriota bacterium]